MIEFDFLEKKNVLRILLQCKTIGRLSFEKKSPITGLDYANERLFNLSSKNQIAIFFSNLFFFAVVGGG